jgi:hypothetical protein
LYSQKDRYAAVLARAWSNKYELVRPPRPIRS